MEKYTLHIKNMVCERCIAAVRRILLDHGLLPIEITLGKAVIRANDAPDQSMIAAALSDCGLELIRDREEVLTEQLKLAVMALVHQKGIEADGLPTSAYLAREFGKSYGYLSKVFSRRTGVTLERYIIRHRIERVKELLQYGELSLSEIAIKMNYSSVQHLSRQFKQVVGMSARSYRAENHFQRIALDQLGKSRK